MLLRLFACKHYVDDNYTPGALESLQEAEALYDECRFERPQDICAEFAFVNAFYKHDLAAAELWWQRIEAMQGIEPDADYWRAKTSILWLKGERDGAFAAWHTGNAMAEQLPSAGVYDFTRSCFARLRKALDAAGNAVSPPHAAALESPETHVAVV